MNLMFKITVLASAGQRYTETRLDQQGKQYLYTGTVAEGNMRIQIVSPPRSNLNSFYDKATQVLATAQVVAEMKRPRIRFNHKKVSS